LILTRYLAKDVLLNTAAVTLVLVLVAISNQFVLYLSRAAAGELPVGLVLEVVALNLPFLLSVLLPFGFFLGVLLAYGRLYTETEMTVMLACGFSIKRLVWTTMVVGSGIAILCGILSLWTAPASTYRLEYLLAHVKADVLANFIKAGQFQTWGEGQYVVYIGDINDKERTVNQVFIAEQPQENASITLTQEEVERLSVLTATTGYLWLDPETQTEYIVLKEGKRYLGAPGNAAYTLMDFNEYGVRLPTQEVNVRERARAQPTEKLIASNDPELLGELQWRLTLPISVIVVALLGVPLSRVPPRKGRFHAIFPALIAMLIYTLGLMLTRTWVIEGWMSATFGLLWPHITALMLAGFLLAKQTHWFKRIK
jgi:lipopolysaccharide export system permease protein